jgi:serine/threonine protein kinase
MDHTTYDAPIIVANCSVRPTSTVPQQALALLNSPFARARAEAFARRVQADAGPDADKRLALAFRLACVSGEEVRSGTPAYQAPEQLRGEAVSVQSDLFALGLVLYEVFTGKRAYLATTRLYLAARATKARPAMPTL